MVTHRLLGKARIGEEELQDGNGDRCSMVTDRGMALTRVDVTEVRLGLLAWRAALQLCIRGSVDKKGVALDAMEVGLWWHDG